MIDVFAAIKVVFPDWGPGQYGSSWIINLPAYLELVAMKTDMTQEEVIGAVKLIRCHELQGDPYEGGFINQGHLPRYVDATMRGTVEKEGLE